MHVIEMTWSYMAPVCITAVLDMRVLFLRPPRLYDLLQLQQSQSDHTFDFCIGVARLNSSTGNEEGLSAAVKSDRKNGARSLTAIYQWLAITTINLLFNAPDFVLQMLTIFDVDPSSNFLFSPAAICTARLLYFVQFCINACYLSTVVFRRHIRSHGGTPTSLLWQKIAVLVASLNVNNTVARSSSNSAPLLSLANLEPWPEH